MSHPMTCWGHPEGRTTGTTSSRTGAARSWTTCVHDLPPTGTVGSFPHARPGPRHLPVSSPTHRVKVSPRRSEPR